MPQWQFLSPAAEKYSASSCTSRGKASGSEVKFRRSACEVRWSEPIGGIDIVGGDLYPYVLKIRLGEFRLTAYLNGCRL
jgi:hypothetical protein